MQKAKITTSDSLMSDSSLPSSPVPDSPCISFVSWDTHRSVLLSIRLPVFVDEQGVPFEEEIDHWDPVCEHALALFGDEPVGCGRLLSDGHIGRMAVHEAHRGRGVGRALLRALMERAVALGHRVLRLSAQVHAMAFYESLGFVAEGEVYDEVGIPHIAMIWVQDDDVD
jgi:predicted GNAT family N-acyltransferase